MRIGIIKLHSLKNKTRISITGINFGINNKFIKDSETELYEKYHFSKNIDEIFQTDDEKT